MAWMRVGTLAEPRQRARIHLKWDCKYHVVFVPKRRKKTLYGKVRKCLGAVFHAWASQCRSEMLEGPMVQDQVHRLIRIPAKYSVAEVVGCSKGKSAIAVARQCGGRKRNFHGEAFRARGYAVSTVGFEEEQRAYRAAPAWRGSTATWQRVVASC